ncbi:MAG: AAA family ATPase, partial [Candidatus Margulisiibacteriota bacterium]
MRKISGIILNMLKSIFIKNFALIDELELDFEDGFTILTGETGAGKSIIIDAISLLTGNAASDDFIKGEQTEAIVEGVFEINEPNLLPFFQDFLEEGSKEIIILRKISKNKTSMAKINYQTVNLKKLKELAKYLISITNQFEHLLLFNHEKQLALLDSFVVSCTLYDLEDLKQTYKSKFLHRQIIREKLNQLDQNNLQLNHHLDLLKYQIQDLEAQDFLVNEEAELKKKKQEIKYCKTINLALIDLKSNLELISKSNHQNILTLGKLGEIKNHVFDLLTTKFNQFSIEIDDAAAEIKKQESSLSQIDEDTSLEQTEARLDQIFKYKTKYKVNSIEALCDLLENLKIEYQELMNQDQSKADLEKDFQQIGIELINLAQKIHQIRLEKARNIAELMNKHLKDLNFTHADFKIAVNYHEGDFFINGKDKIEFLISLNQGEPVKPIEKVASG